MTLKGDMQVLVDSWQEQDIEGLKTIWNGIVATGQSFPQEELLDSDSAKEFFSMQSFVGVARCNSRIVGFYILHPNNVGRCAHIANASYAVRPDSRGKGIGRALVEHSLITAKDLGFRIMQFNAVLATNTVAAGLYESLGFKKLGTIEEGFRLDDGSYVDITPMYKNLVE